VAECGHVIDPRRHATCAVCNDLILCIECARTHLCTSECAARGCLPSLCVKEVRNGVVAAEFGVR
jgi:hypothetical protein